MIEKLPRLARFDSEYGITEIVNKINEIIEHLAPEEPKRLTCLNCGSDKWARTAFATAMGGPVNFYTYSCFECGKPTEIKRVSHTAEYQRVRLGPEDEIIHK